MFIFVFYVVVRSFVCLFGTGCNSLVMIKTHFLVFSSLTLLSLSWSSYSTTSLFVQPYTSNWQTNVCATVAKSFSSGYYIQLDFVHYVDFTHAKCSCSCSLFVYLSMSIYWAESSFIHLSLSNHKYVQYTVQYNWKLIQKPRSSMHTHGQS